MRGERNRERDRDEMRGKREEREERREMLRREKREIETKPLTLSVDGIDPCGE